MSDTIRKNDMSEETNRWMPIETAPKENESIILGGSSGKNARGLWVESLIRLGDSWVQISDSGRATSFHPTQERQIDMSEETNYRNYRHVTLAASH